MLPHNKKLFCVGFQKTGTSSMSVAFKALGFDVTDAFRGVNRALKRHPADPDATVKNIVLEKMKSADAIQDAPANFFYEEFDQAYPGSKFILTYRPVDSWLASYANFFRDVNSPLHQWMYGVDRFWGNEERFRSIYLDQNDKIRRYFANRPDDFLEFNLFDNHGWYELVKFLGPDFLPPFPKENINKPPK
jgi:hypothetical protein